MNEENRFLRVLVLASAQFEIEEIADLYCSLSGKASAKQITEKIYAALEQLSCFPFSGPAMRDTELRAQGYRYLVVEKYLILYRVIDSTVTVYHIFDGRSDYPKLLKSGMFR